MSHADLFWCSKEHVLRRAGQRYDSWSLTWVEDTSPVETSEQASLTPLEAATALFSPARGRGVPIGVIGPREPTPQQYDVAEQLGRRLAEIGLTVLCGGKGGVMEAVCRGSLNAGGRPIGLIPDTEWQDANPYVAIPIASGIGVARNAIIARACFALIAVGGGYGTISEMAFGLQFGRLVLALADAPVVPGAIICADVDEAVERACGRILGLDDA